MSKHMSGPWKRGSDNLRSSELWSEVYASNGFLVASVHVESTNSKERGEAHATARATANLIAAAPDLLAALQEARGFISSDHTGSRGDLSGGALGRIDAAIAKATGAKA